MLFKWLAGSLTKIANSGATTDNIRHAGENKKKLSVITDKYQLALNGRKTNIKVLKSIV